MLTKTINEKLLKVLANIQDKLLQYITSILGGLLLAFETSINFFVPCFFAILLDIVSAWMLGRRVHKKYPEKADGKFKSEYKLRVMATMITVLIAIMIAHYVDVEIIKNTDIAVRFVVGAFLFYQGWSILENWSSENDSKVAQALQRVMVNKAERHFNVDLSDIFFGEKQKKEESEVNNE